MAVEPRLSMTSEEAQVIASRLVEEEYGTLECLGVERDSTDKDKWTASFQALSTRGTKLDGPLLVIVSEKTGEAVFFNEWFERQRNPK